MDAAAAQGAVASEKRTRRANETSAKVTLQRRAALLRRLWCQPQTLSKLLLKNALNKYIRDIKDASNGSPNESQKMRLAMAEKKLKDIENEAFSRGYTCGT
jgi:hypothetical protein